MSIAQYGKQFPILLRMANPRGHVELLETIGKGNYGYVYKGKMLRKNNELAAVKVVFLKEDEIKETLLEMEILQSCDHPNITRYLGCFLKSLDFWVLILIDFVDLYGVLWSWFSGFDISSLQKTTVRGSNCIHFV